MTDDAQGPAGHVDPLTRVATDRALRDALIAARGWSGPSPSRFLGRPVRTDYVLDEHGRVAGSVTDPDWTDEDRDLALALLAYEAGLCAGCRQQLRETTAPDAEDGYTVESAVRCHACTALAIAAKDYATNPNPSALLFVPKRRAHRTTDLPADQPADLPADLPVGTDPEDPRHDPDLDAG